MIGKRIAHYKITEKLPSTALRTSGAGGSVCGSSGLNEMRLFNSVRSVMCVANRTIRPLNSVGVTCGF